MINNAWAHVLKLHANTFAQLKQNEGPAAKAY